MGCDKHTYALAFFKTLLEVLTYLLSQFSSKTLAAVYLNILDFLLELSSACAIARMNMSAVFKLAVAYLEGSKVYMPAIILHQVLSVKQTDICLKATFNGVPVILALRVSVRSTLFQILKLRIPCKPRKQTFHVF